MLVRNVQVTIEDYVEHARVSGRKVVGFTDHFGKYILKNQEWGI